MPTKRIPITLHFYHHIFRYQPNILIATTDLSFSIEASRQPSDLAVMPRRTGLKGEGLSRGQIVPVLNGTPEELDAQVQTISPVWGTCTESAGTKLSSLNLSIRKQQNSILVAEQGAKSRWKGTEDRENWRKWKNC